MIWRSATTMTSPSTLTITITRATDPVTVPIDTVLWLDEESAA
jgi:hypothetical protein